MFFFFCNQTIISYGIVPCLWYSTLCIASVLQKVEEDCNSGFLIGGQLISDLSYTDDIAAVSTSMESLQKYLEFRSALARHAEEVGLLLRLSS